MATVDGSYLEIMDSITNRTFVRRKRKNTSVTFSELGPYYTHKSYRMEEVHFWRLYNLLKPYKRVKKGNVLNKEALQMVKFHLLYV